MSEQKSKLPDFNEITSMAGKLFKDVKKSVCEIVKDYQTKRKDSAPSPEKTASPGKTEETTTKPAEPKEGPKE